MVGSRVSDHLTNILIDKSSSKSFSGIDHLETKEL